MVRVRSGARVLRFLGTAMRGINTGGNQYVFHILDVEHIFNVQL